MALTLLNPGLRPLGQFDLDDANAGGLVGGEYVELQAAGADLEAFDVTALTDAAGTVNFIRTAGRTAGNLGGLADEGSAGDNRYGTLFGSLIGTTTGLATTVAGATVIGPATDLASGKVTVWAQAGLYGVSQQSNTLLLGTNAGVALAPNIIVHAADGVAGDVEFDGATATTDSLLTIDLIGGAIGAGRAQVGLTVGTQADPSLVSTTTAALGIGATAQHSVIFYNGNAQA